ncbi:MAG: hypothetical protein JRF63_08440 [Deltaproteobacteria bacterium]|nr:hypothetical protein [Deltaproteobacteria bacterium]
MNTQIPEPGDKPRKRRFHGDPPFFIRFAFGFVIGAVIGVAVFYEPFAGTFDWTINPSPWPMVLFVAGFGVVGGLLAGFFRRKRSHD